MLRIRGEPAWQIEFESNRLAIYTTQANIFRSFLRQAKNLIAIRYKRQALHNYKITKVRPKKCACVCVCGGGGGGGGAALLHTNKSWFPAILACE